MCASLQNDPGHVSAAPKAVAVVAQWSDLRQAFARFAAAVVVASGFIACSGDLTEREPLTGTFPLVTFDESPLPFFLAPIPTRDGRESFCNIVVTEGFLTIDSSERDFEFAWLTRNSCNRQLLSTFGEIGDLQRSGRLLTLTAHYPSAPDRTFIATIGRGEITVKHFEHSLSFRW
jgi:hypothetical protein